MNTIPSAAGAYLRQLCTLAKLKPQILRLREAVGSPNELSAFQWAQLMAMMFEFKPDLILELGRERGNSTCAFTMVANELSATQTCRVLSLCFSKHWRAETMPKLQTILPAAWFSPLSALETDICSFDYRSSLASVQRVAVFWDAHGFEVAGAVLGKIMPELADKPHVVIMHDLCDARYLGEDSRLYADKPLWTGNDWSGPRVRLGHIDSNVEQTIAALDFTNRNRIELHSADHSLHTELAPSQRAEMENLLGELYSLNAYWVYFSLNEGYQPFSFPRYKPKEPRHENWLARTASRWKRSIAKRLRL